MSADENIKKFTLVGGKSELEALGKQGSRKRRGGAAGPSNVPPGPSYQMASANVQKAQVQTQAPVPVPVQNGAAYNQHKNVKVILTPKKKKTAVVLEAPKKKKLPITLSSGQKGGTRKVAKKIRMNISNMSKRMTRANEIRKEAKAMTIDKIKAAIKAAGLIKETTKAPDAILKSMYVDYFLLKNKAL
jgi:hypothetical protein